MKTAEKSTTETVKGEFVRISLDQMELYKNPRKDLKDIKGLAATIVAAGGITQPMKGFYREVKPGEWKYLVVDGQRRFTAEHLLKEMNEHAELLVNIPFLIMPDGMTEFEIRKNQILSNEGEPLSPLELADAILESIEEGHSIAEVAEGLGKSKVYIAELKKLAELPEYIKAMIRKGVLSATLVREQIKAGTLDAFIANINENGLESGEDLPSEDVTGEIEKEANQRKVTAKDLKPNSIKEFKRFAAAFSEVFTTDEEGKQKQVAYEFATGLIRNEMDYEAILAFFTSEKTAQFDTPEKQALRQRANEQTGRAKKSRNSANAGNSDAQNSANEGGDVQTPQNEDNPDNWPVIGENEETGADASAAFENIENALLKDTEKEVAAPKKAAPKKAAAKKAPAKKQAAPKKAAAKKEAAPKKEVIAPSKSTSRKIGYDKKAGTIAE